MPDSPQIWVGLLRPEAEWLLEEAEQEGADICEEDWQNLRDHLRSALQPPPQEVKSSHAEQAGTTGGDHDAPVHDPSCPGEPRTQGSPGVGADPAAAGSPASSPELATSPPSEQPWCGDDRDALIRMGIRSGMTAKGAKTTAAPILRERESRPDYPSQSVYPPKNDPEGSESARTTLPEQGQELAEFLRAEAASVEAEAQDTAGNVGRRAALDEAKKFNEAADFIENRFSPEPVISADDKKRLGEIAPLAHDYFPESRSADDAAFLSGLAGEEGERG